MRIATRVIAYGVGTALAVALGLGACMVLVSSHAADERVALLERTKRAEFDESAKRQVEAALSMLASVEARVHAGELSSAEAMRLGADLLRGLHYGLGGYFWADTFEGVNVVLLGSAAEGKPRLDAVDANGFPFIREILARGRSGGGFTDYAFPKPGGVTPVRKRSYAAAFEPFRWVIGTGNYLDDIDRALAAERLDAEVRNQTERWTILLSVLAIALAAAVLSSLLARTITRPVERLLAESGKLHKAVSEGDLDFRVDDAAVSGEFRPILRGMNETMEAFVGPFRATTDCFARLSRGDVPGKVAGEHRGEFAALNATLNRSIDAINLLVSDALALAKSASEGDMSSKVEASRHEGEFRKIVVGVNTTLDALRVVFDSSPDPMTISRIRDGVLVAVNQGFLKMHGLKEADVLGRSSRTLGILIESDRREELAEAVMRDGSVSGQDLLVRDAQGRQRILSFSARRVSLAEEPHMLAVTHDVTEQRRAQEHLQQAHKMEAIGRLASGVAHDFNNLLVTVLSGCGFLLDEERSDHEVRQELELIRSTGLRAAELVRQLLTFSRQGALRDQRCDLGGQLRALEPLLRRAAGAGVRVEFEHEGPAPEVLLGSSQLDQVLMNLAINARDAMNGEGVLRFQTRRVQTTPEDSLAAGLPAGDWVEISVADTGCGMPPEVRARMFEPFFTTKEPGKGTGLGLATVFAIVEQAGGHLAVESTVGVGTTFRVLLAPAKGQAAAAQEAEEAEWVREA